MAYKLLIGGYTENGLRSLSFDPVEKKLELASATIPAGASPSWIVAHPSDNTLIFATNEVEDGRVLAIKLSGLETPELTGELVANLSSGGEYPAHLLLTKESIVAGNVRTLHSICTLYRHAINSTWEAQSSRCHILHRLSN